MAIVDGKIWAQRLMNISGRARMQFASLGKNIASESAKRAKEKLGTYQPGWPALAESTIAEKLAKGFSIPSPLLRTGDMRDSIRWDTEREDSSSIVVNISADHPADIHEYGSVNVPPRPFMRPALEEILEEMGEDDLEEIMMFVFGFDDTPMLTLRMKK